MDRSVLAEHVAGLRVLDARGVRIDRELLAALLDAFGEPDGFGQRLGDVDFSDATFTDGVAFSECVFAGFARFGGARFDYDATFGGSTFEHTPVFEGAEFNGHAGFTIMDRPADGVQQHTIFAHRARFAGARFLGGATFDGATFRRTADFEGAEFSQGTTFHRAEFTAWASFVSISSGWEQRQDEFPTLSFAGAHFAGGLDLGRARLVGNVSFEGSRFDHGTSFAGTHFGGWARFDDAAFSGKTSFTDPQGPATEFAGDASFQRVAFTGPTEFADVIFHQRATFARARLAGDFTFDRTRFLGEASFDESALTGHGHRVFDGTVCEGVISFQGAAIERARTFGPVALHSRFVLDRATFIDPLRIDASGGLITAVQAQFRKGLDLRLRWSSVLFEDVDLSAPSSIATAVPFEEIERAESAEGESPHATPRPRILSLRRSNVSGLYLDDVDLRPCRFAGATNLSSLRIDGTESFAFTPDGWRWTRRRAIAEEHQWRSDRRHGEGWYPKACQPDLDDVVSKPDRPFTVQGPAALAPIYRALRVGHEANRDEPGAADSYYGEMEMRRRAGDSRSERLLLTAYWLVAGYGLRASRALTALVVTIILFSLIFWAFGFADRRPYIDALVFTTADSSSLFRAPASGLNLFGTVLELGLRLLGPLFIGLALLSVRGRIKR
jgi:uncharacterized protein YjbI with pentapeptide repeats